jgi:hypothetical protein
MFLLHTQTRVLATIVLLVCSGLVIESLVRVKAPDETTYRNEINQDIMDFVVSTIRPSDNTGPKDSPFVVEFNSKMCSKGVPIGSRIDALDDLLMSMSASHLSGNAPLTSDYAVDKELMAATLLNSSKFRVDEVCGAVGKLLSGGQEALRNLRWREYEPASQIAKFGSSFVMPGNFWASKSNPWGVLPGCTFLSSRGNWNAYFSGKGASQLCTQADATIASEAIPVQAKPADFDSIQRSLRREVMSLEESGKGVFGAFSGNNLSVMGHEVYQSPHVLSTLEVASQRTMQAVSSCYTGNMDACGELGLDARAWDAHYEKAGTRMIGMVLVDIPTGEIQSIGSGHTRCFEQEYDGPGRDKDCLRLPTEPRMRRWMLENHALHTSVMPGSLVKPIAALAMMSDAPYKQFLMGKGASEFREDLKQSRSARFHDRLFCKDKAFEKCTRQASFATAAEMVGWNMGCTKSGICSSLNLASGVETEEIGANFLAVHPGRAGIRSVKTPKNGWQAVPSEFDSNWARDCSLKGKNGWEKCDGGSGSAVDLLSEAWGQGNSHATPIGVATMLSYVATAANGSREVKLPHLLRASRTKRTLELPVSGVSNSVPSDAASLILSGMALSHTKGGTANSACVAVYKNAKVCDQLNWLAGKTGTPVFVHDTLRSAVRLEHCLRVRSDLNSATTSGKRKSALSTEWANCTMSPYKWYAAALRSNGSATGPWDKAIVVVAERNWNQKTGLVDGPKDTGVNIAARAAFDFISRAYPQNQTQSNLQK